jgi:hypothetical protein
MYHTHHVHCLCNAGIAHNKLLAKLASAMNKPNKQTVVPHRSVASIMATLPVKKIRNFGGKVGQVLEELGCKTAADVQKLRAETLVARFGGSKRAECVCCPPSSFSSLSGPSTACPLLSSQQLNAEITCLAKPAIAGCCSQASSWMDIDQREEVRGAHKKHTRVQVGGAHGLRHQ